MAERDLSTMSTKELYDFKGRLDVQRDRVKGRRGPGPSHTRHYCRTMRQVVDAILKGRGAPLRQPGSHQRIYGPGAAKWQRG